MFGISVEHLIIAFVVLLIVGPKRLPQLGAAAGKGLRNLKEQYKGILEPEYRKLPKSEKKV